MAAQRAAAPAASSLPPLQAHRARGPCVAGHGRLPPRAGTRFTPPLLTRCVRDAARALPCTSRTRRRVPCCSSGGCISPYSPRTHASALRLGPGSSASPSRRTAPRSRYAPSIATPGTASVDSPRLHACGTAAYFASASVSAATLRHDLSYPASLFGYSAKPACLIFPAPLSPGHAMTARRNDQSSEIAYALGWSEYLATR